MKRYLCFSIALAMLAICLMACTPSVATPPDNTTAREAGQTDVIKDSGNDPAVTGGEQSGADESTAFPGVKCDCLIGYWPDDYKQQAPGDMPGPDVVPVLEVSGVGSKSDVALSAPCEDSSTLFAYYYNPATGKERMVTINMHNNITASFAVLSIYEVTLGGPRGFYAAMEAGKCSAVLLTSYYCNGWFDADYLGCYYNGDTLTAGNDVTILKNADEAVDNTLFAAADNVGGTRRWYVCKLKNASAESDVVKSFDNDYDIFGARCNARSLVSVD